MTWIVLTLLACGGKQTEANTSADPAPEPVPAEPAPVPEAAPVKTALGSGSRAAPSPRWAPAATSFALDLHRGTEPGNTTVSGASAYIALSMLAEGARGATREQLEAALGGPIDKAFHVDNARALAAINGTPDVTLSSANGLWVDEGMTLEQEFTDALGSRYGAPPSTLPFSSDTEAAAAAINGWTSENTNGMIDKLFDAGQLQGAVFALANAIAFEGTWLTPFEEDATQDGTFATPDGDKTVPMMHSGEKRGYLDGEGYQAVVLRYQGKMSSLVLLLPDEDSSLEALEASLTPDLLREAALVKGARPVDLALPKFEMELTHDLKKAVPDALKPALEGGDYSGIAPGVVIGPVVQKAFIQVDEKGTKAAAATGVVGVKSMPPPPVVVHFDRPFLYALWHVETGVPLFTGRVVDPS